MRPNTIRISLETQGKTPSADTGNGAMVAPEQRASRPELDLNRPNPPTRSGELLPLNQPPKRDLADLPRPLVIHVRGFLDGPDALVLATASRTWAAIIEKNPDPVLKDVFAARRTVAREPCELLSEEVAAEGFAALRRRFTPVAWSKSHGEAVAVPAPLLHEPIYKAWMSMLEKSLQVAKENAERSAHIRGMRFSIARSEAGLAITPLNFESVRDAAASLCWLGRTNEAEQVLRWRLQWCPDDAQTWQNLGELLTLARKYDQAIAAMGTSKDLQSPHGPQRLDDDLRGTHSCSQGNPEICSANQDAIALALLLQGKVHEAYGVVHFHGAEPLTRALVYHSLGRPQDAEDALAQIESFFERATFHAWKGDALTAASSVYAGLIAASQQEKKPALATHGLLNVANSPFFDPIRDQPEWQKTLHQHGLTPEVLKSIRFDLGPINPTLTRRNAELQIREKAAVAENGFRNTKGGGHAMYLGSWLCHLGRFEQAEQVLRWELERSGPRAHLSSANRWLVEALLAMGRRDEARAHLELVNDNNETRHLLGRIRLLSGEAQVIYDQESRAEQPNQELLALAAHSLGLFEQRDAICKQLENKLTAVIRVKAWSGKADDVFELLHHAVAIERADELLRSVIHSPFMAPIRSDARWELFLRSANMAPDQLAAISLQFELPPLPLPLPTRA